MLPASSHAVGGCTAALRSAFVFASPRSVAALVQWQPVGQKLSAGILQAEHFPTACRPSRLATLTVCLPSLRTELPHSFPRSRVLEGELWEITLAHHGGSNTFFVVE